MKQKGSRNPIRELLGLGQSIWYDYIRRDLFKKARLQRLIDEDGLRGMTTNPAIFEKAVAASDLYDDAIREAGPDASPASVYERIAIEDVRRAADAFEPVFRATDGMDGYVSLEVSPKLARNATATLSEARRLWKAVDRPNVMIKIPGTAQGLEAIEQCLYEGIPVNVTLLFGVARYREVMNAYLTALERRHADKRPVDNVASVASFFISRIDSLLDKRVAGLAGKDPDDVRTVTHQMGIANAKMAYQAFLQVFRSERYGKLARFGAKLQRPLWASTSTKNPNLPDTLYVEQLIAQDSVNTVPPETYQAYRDHGRPAVRIEDDLYYAREAFASLGRLGIDFDAITAELEDEGIRKFVDAYEGLLATIAHKQAEFKAA